MAPGNFSQTTYSWRDVMTATIKTHTLKFGADLFNTREWTTREAHSRVQRSTTATSSISFRMSLYPNRVRP